MLVSLSKVLPVLILGEDKVIVSTICDLKIGTIIGIEPTNKWEAYVELLTKKGEWQKGLQQITPVRLGDEHLFAIVSDLKDGWREVDAL